MSRVRSPEVPRVLYWLDDLVLLLLALHAVWRAWCFVGPSGRWQDAAVAAANAAVVLIRLSGWSVGWRDGRPRWVRDDGSTRETRRDR